VTPAVEPHVRQTGGLPQRPPRAPPRGHRPRGVEAFVLAVPWEQVVFGLGKAEPCGASAVACRRKKTANGRPISFHQAAMRLDTCERRSSAYVAIAASTLNTPNLRARLVGSSGRFCSSAILFFSNSFACRQSVVPSGSRCRSSFLTRLG